ncbi:5369_t:CDS:2, partial [Rhizophagus irregularis]
IKTKCRSRRNDFATSIRSAMFSVFGEQRLECINNNSSSMKIAEWKQNQKTHNAFYELFKNHNILTKIGHSIFKHTLKLRFLTCNSTQLDSLGALRIMKELAEREVKEVSQRTDQYESAVAEESSESVKNKNYDD